MRCAASIAPRKQSPDLSLVVHGRFHAFSMARELARQGMQIEVITNYPASVARRWLPDSVKVVSLVSHGLLSRVSQRSGLVQRLPGLDKALHQFFGRWASRTVSRSQPRLVHCFSGVALELMRQAGHSARPPKIILARGSAHIAEQRDLLIQESIRLGRPVDHPSDWMVERELAEYGSSDRIVVLSEFARNSFLQRGVHAEKLAMIPLGVDPYHFGSTEIQRRERISRLSAGRRLRVLCTGSFCARKGARDFVDVARRLSHQMDFVWVGGVSQDAAYLAREAGAAVELMPKVSEFALQAHYQNADLYFLPTIEDGFAATLSQALICGMPVLGTTHSAAPELLRAGGGWVVEPRDQAGMVACLQRAAADPASLVPLVRLNLEQGGRRTWREVGADFIALYRRVLTS